MNQCHEANRSHWNADAQRWKELKDEMGNWHLCHSDPSIMFDDVHLPGSVLQNWIWMSFSSGRM